MMMRPKDLRQGSGTKSFLEAMHGGKVHLARFILDALDGRIINSKTENNRTPLMHAICLQDPAARAKFTKLLLEKGADVNCQDEDGRTALSHACELGHLDVVKLLVQYNADPDASDAWGNSALMYAAFSGHSQVLEFLVRAFKRLGLTLDRTNNVGHSALEVAAFFGHNQCVQILNCSSRRAMSADTSQPASDALANGERRLPNRLPKHILERFSKHFHGNHEDHLPGVFQRQLRIGDGGLWNRLRYPRNQSQEDSLRPSPCPPAEQQKGQAEGAHNVLFSAKQLQNHQTCERKGSKMLNSLRELRQREVGQENRLQDKPLQRFTVWEKAKSFNLDYLSVRKQSYQGDGRDISLLASKQKRASLPEERCLTDKLDGLRKRSLTNDADKALSLPKPLSNAQLARSPEESENESQASSARQNKLLSARGGMESGKVLSSRAPALAALGTRLLRRFTAPDFMRSAMDCATTTGVAPPPLASKGQMSRSETFPLSCTHQQVCSQPSVDSISGVRCEFELSSAQSTIN